MEAVGAAAGATAFGTAVLRTGVVATAVLRAGVVVLDFETDADLEIFLAM
jgi:hypothetical protein